MKDSYHDSALPVNAPRRPARHLPPPSLSPAGSKSRSTPATSETGGGQSFPNAADLKSPGYSDTPQPAYYAVIPASVRYCKSLPPSAKLLYGEITALCTVTGYCWAGTEHFAGLYQVDGATVRRWLAALAREGFIQIEVNREWPEQRRIYLLETMPKPGGEAAQKRAGGRAKMPDPSRKNARQSIKENKTENKTLNVGAEATSLPVVAGDAVAAPPRVVVAGEVERAVSEVVSLTDDAKSERRFRQLHDLADDAGLLSEWDNALAALKVAVKRRRKPVAAPGAYFATVLTRFLNRHGVYVPVGTSDDRAEVRALIAQSLGGEA